MNTKILQSLNNTILVKKKSQEFLFLHKSNKDWETFPNFGADF